MKSLLSTLRVIACIACAAHLASTAAAQEGDLSGLAPMDTAALEDLRGGFFTVDGITFDFGAIVRTTIDGQPALESRLTWTPQGVLVEDLSAYPSGVLPGGGWGIDLSDASGMTLVGHQLLDGQMQGFILNSGDGRDISQSLEVTLTLPGFDAIQRSMTTDRIGLAIGMDVTDGLIRASGQ
jgi:hypothetical protein